MKKLVLVEAITVNGQKSCKCPFCRFDEESGECFCAMSACYRGEDGTPLPGPDCPVHNSEPSRLLADAISLLDDYLKTGVAGLVVEARKKLKEVEGE